MIEINWIVQKFKKESPKWVVLIRWATATGKTSLSIELARGFWDVEIISADSRQLYMHMDIGTDKISKEIRAQVPHHMVDIIDPSETFTAGQWKEMVENIIDDIHARGKTPVVVWGTWLYIDMLYKNFCMPEVAPDQDWRDIMEAKESDNKWFLHARLQEVDPEEAMKHHPNSTRYILRALEIYEKTWVPKSQLAKELPVKRPLLMIGLRREKEDTNRRINKRIKEMLADGWLIQENKMLLEKWYTLSDIAMNGIWYKEVIGYLEGEYNLDRCEELLKRNTHRYAKRQRSWFRRYIAESKVKRKENVEYVIVEL